MCKIEISTYSKNLCFALSLLRIIIDTCPEFWEIVKISVSCFS